MWQINLKTKGTAISDLTIIAVICPVIDFKQLETLGENYYSYLIVNFVDIEMI